MEMIIEGKKERPNTLKQKNDINAPNIKDSPWAKFVISRIPKIMVSPRAMRV